MANQKPAETPEARERRLAWWREARFGMFIHWGLYAIPAGTWKGEQIPGIGEWIMHRARIPVKEYEQLAKQFNPVKFNADEWVSLAKEAGMKYITITSKHHDGFCLFKTNVHRYNIVDATPFKRDVLKELAEACQRHGLRLCFYYSHAQDWHEPNAAGNTWDFGPDEQKNFAQYFEDVAKPHVRELLTNYGPIGMIWFDTPRLITKEQSAELVDLVHSLQPDCLVNGRVGHGYGDYQSMGDNQIPGAIVEGDWETPATINDTWGYKSYDHNWKPVEVLVQKLVEIVSKGGNYLLNVGPTAEGVIPEPSVERLRAMGRWLQVNGESIYGAGRSPFRRLPYRCTAKPGRLYIHLFEWPGERVVIPGLGSPVTKAYLLADPNRRALAVERTEEGIAVSLPNQAPDALDSVLALEIEGEPCITERLLTQSADGTVTLPASEAILDARQAHYDPSNNGIANWTGLRDYVFWDFTVTQPGTFAVVATQACTEEEAGSTYHVVVANQRVLGEVKPTGSWTEFADVQVGRVELPQAGNYTLAIRPVTLAGKALMCLRAITLKPAR